MDHKRQKAISVLTPLASKGVNIGVHDCMGWWWLRSPGNNSNNAANVNNNGNINQNGNNVNNNQVAVRPASPQQPEISPKRGGLCLR